SAGEGPRRPDAVPEPLTAGIDRHDGDAGRKPAHEAAELVAHATRLRQADPEAAEQEERQERDGDHDPDRDGDVLLEVHGASFCRGADVPAPLCNHRGVPASASIPSRGAARPTAARSRLRPVLFAVLVALVPTAIVAWAVGRNQADHVSQKATTAVVAEAQAGKQQVEEVLARARARALAVAHQVPVQRALARRDVAALALFARQHPGTYFIVRGREIPSRRPPEAARRTVVVTLGKRTIGTVAAAVPASSL